MRQELSTSTEPAARLLAVREVAARLGVSTRQVWKLASGGRIPKPVRLAGSVRWNERQLTAFIDGGCAMEGEARR